MGVFNLNRGQRVILRVPFPRLSGVFTRVITIGEVGCAYLAAVNGIWSVPQSPHLGHPAC